VWSTLLIFFSFLCNVEFLGSFDCFVLFLFLFVIWNMLRYGYLIRNGQPDWDGKRRMCVAMTYFNLGAFELSELQNFRTLLILSLQTYARCVTSDIKYYLFTCKSTDINLLRCKYIQPYFYNNPNVYKMKGMLSICHVQFMRHQIIITNTKYYLN
jgi:hypothetical protein